MLKLISRSTTPVVTLEEVVEHLRRGDTDEDDRLIERYVNAATRHVENWCALSLVDQTWDYYFDEFPDGTDPYGRYILIPRPPLLEIEAIYYRDSAGVEQEFNTNSYLIDYTSHPSRVFLTAAGSWPDTDGAMNSGRIRFRAGYVDESSPTSADNLVPEDIKAAIQIYAANLYENRESFATGTAFNVAKFPWGVENLLRMYRVDTSLA
jgi:uncharacterized phiE125 gp8 family phage protein